VQELALRRWEQQRRQQQERRVDEGEEQERERRGPRSKCHRVRIHISRQEAISGRFRLVSKTVARGVSRVRRAENFSPKEEEEEEELRKENDIGVGVGVGVSTAMEYR